MIEAVLLDAGGVLVLPEHEALLSVLTRLGIDERPLDLDGGHYAAMCALDVFDANTEEGWTAYLAAWGKHLCSIHARREAVTNELRDVFRSITWSRVIDSSLEALRVLSERGIPLAVVSNSNGMAERHLRESGVCQVGPGNGVEVSIVIDSHIVGVAKPDPAIFAMALDAVGVGADRAVHVGDSLRADVAGAQAARIRPLHFDPYGFCEVNAHEHVRSLPEVVELV